ncbi:MAG: LysM peptidoglycan-binding domain-containing protein [Bdellovibrionales bacterium]|nr:LysM peptidoglycan-binding domain-containing protein [Bdellovibrionales bacterium]
MLHRDIFFLPFVLVVLGGCAFIQPDDNILAPPDSRGAKIALPPGRSNVEKIESLTIDDVVKREEPSTAGLYDNSRYDFPITINSKVEGWMDYFTGRGRVHFERYLARSSRYIPLMKHILRNSGLPEDLVYLAMIESGFNIRAKSIARAVGPWQFMPATGTRYGLRVDSWIDERQDPIRSTEAAARYLKDLYLMFESWYLAAAAYNAGENKLLRAVRELKTNNYWTICKSRYIARETKDYVPKLIAAAILAKNPERFNFEEIVYQDPLDFENVAVKYPIHLRDIAELINSTEDELRYLNPELRRGVIPPATKEYSLRVPVGTQVLVQKALIAKKSDLEKSIQPVQYSIRRGDNLYLISRRFGVSIKELTDLNGISRRTRLKVGRQLMIPSYANTSTPTKERVVAAKSRPKTTKTKEEDDFITHTVRKGESLWSIAVKYNVTVQQIFRWNHLKRSQIQPGKTLRINPGT